MAKVTNNYNSVFLMGERLKECRDIKGLSQEQLAEAVESLPDNHGKTRSAKHISYLENGTRAMSVEYANLLSQVLNVRPEYLLLKDNYRTEAERISESENRHCGKFDLIVKLLQFHGYSVEDVTKAMPIQTDTNGRKFRTETIALISPRGTKRLFSNEDFSELLSRIDDSIEMQCAFQFRKMRDGVSNIYDWEV